MSLLRSIKDDVQRVAEVIQSVLKVDVTIVDENFERVAGTGIFQSLVGLSIEKNTVFAKVLKGGKSFFIDSPGNCRVCDTCSKKDSCKELAEVCCPIIFEGKAIGVIGFVVFDEIQKVEFIENREGLLGFLNQMAELISARVLEGQMLERNKMLRKELQTIVDTIDEGIIAIDERGSITHLSLSAQKILGMEKEDLVGRKLEVILPEISGRIEGTKDINDRELLLSDALGTRIIYSTRSLVHDGYVKGTVIVIRAMSDVKKIINRISGNSFNICFDDIIGEAPLTEQVKLQAKRAASGNSTVFIMGESGTGKEMFARAIHSSSNRSNKPFVAINCAAIPESLLESELFGYEEGSFTGARKGGKLGKFELANGGTIFLDEIGDMPLHLQTKLLRVLQDRSIERVGGHNNIPLDVRVIAATHKDIGNMLSEGEFRQDLYYRLNVIPLIIPPLRDRKEDIPVLMKHILEKCNRKLEKSIVDFNDEVYVNFMGYNWPGNIRELENSVEYAVNMEEDCYINIGSLPHKLRKEKSNLQVINKNNVKLLTIKELERMAIIEALEILNGNRDEAAKILGISRATFYRKLKEYEI